MDSVFTKDVDKTCPLPEYPRPQLVRKLWMNLNGTFEYAVRSGQESQPENFDGRILVPFSVETPLSGVGRPLLPEERLWYRKRFSLPQEMQGKTILLHFGAVDWQCEVFINGKSVGTHVGGYCPFTLDITSAITAQENELTVCVYDPTDAGWQQRGKQVLEPKGFWYTATSGIWQTVWLEAVAENYVEKLQFTPNIDRQTIAVKTVLHGESQSGEKTVLKLQISFENETVFSGEIAEQAEISLPNPKLWSPETPCLYDVCLEVFQNGVCTDRVTSYFGMRKFHAARDDKGIMRLFLNNKPYFQKGLLDQGYWCDGGMTPPTDAAMIYDIQTAKDLGFNLLRKHIKIEPQRWYYHCDRLGMLVWQDMMSGGKYIGDFYAGFLPNIGLRRLRDNNYARFSRTEQAWRDDYMRELGEMVDTLSNAVSIYAWVPFNEAWGQFDALEVCRYVQSLDSTRLVDHASGWYDQGGGDMQSIHRYILPVTKPRRDHRVFVLSEFGGYSRKVDGHIWNRKKAFGYLMFKDRKSLTKAYEKLLTKQVIPLIEKGLSATVYTQVSDVENEVNGMLTYDRAILKLDAAAVKRLNQACTL